MGSLLVEWKGEEMMSWLYFVRSLETGHINVGVDLTLERRLRWLSPRSTGGLELELCLPGEVEHLTLLRERFSEFRLGGDWFEDEGEFGSFVRVDRSARKFVPQVITPEKKWLVKKTYGKWQAEVDKELVGLTVEELEEADDVDWTPSWGEEVNERLLDWAKWVCHANHVLVVAGLLPVETFLKGGWDVLALAKELLRYKISQDGFRVADYACCFHWFGWGEFLSLNQTRFLV